MKAKRILDHQTAGRNTIDIQLSRWKTFPLIHQIVHNIELTQKYNMYDDLE